jgi:hypothetical protein
MEHRCSPRIETDFHVLICQYSKPIAIGRVKNGTRFGLFIETDWNARPMQQITLEIAPKQSQTLQKNLLEAIVVYKVAQGFGVELETLTDEQAQELQKFLEARPLDTETKRHWEASMPARPKKSVAF